MDTWAKSGPKSALRDVTDMLLAPFYGRIDHRFDRIHNIDTSGSIPLVNLTTANRKEDKDNRKYEPTSVITFRRMISILPRDLSDYVFIDIGSGKGRVLFLASDYNFKQIIGVEFAKELHLGAKKNIATYVSETQRCVDINTVWCDASNFVIPNEQCVFYLFNPFFGAESALKQVISNIAESFTKYPRKMFFLYLNPRQSKLFEELDFIRPIEERRFALKKAIIYESVDQLCATTR